MVSHDPPKNIKKGHLLPRYLFQSVLNFALKRHKMAFISGPRQVGKTTLAKSLSTYFAENCYRNWDDVTFRRQWTKNPQQILGDFSMARHEISKLLVLDEIHKVKGWKLRVKGLFDEYGEDLNIVVTGSARLNVYQKGGDSMMGRYLNFRLHPLSYGELTQNEPLSPDAWQKSLLTSNRSFSGRPEIFENLVNYGGFPEPYFARNPKIVNLWRRGRNEKIIREDLRDLSRIIELSQVEMLTALLPLKVGSSLSIQSLREDLEVSFDTVKRWLRHLMELYFFFELKPWSKSVVRSLKKEGKIYLYDWSEIENKGARFENIIASHLLKAIHFWQDTGEGNFELHYLRNKEKQEVDFLITRQSQPWLMIETKLSSTQIDTRTSEVFKRTLGCPYVQVTGDEGIWHFKDNTLLTSATRLLHGLP